MLSRRLQTAFTLIELLVVISIIALLIALLLPALGRAQQRTRTTQCKINLRGMVQGATAYETDVSTQIPLFDPAKQRHWTEIVRQYQSNTTATYVCPEAGEPNLKFPARGGSSPENRLGARDAAWRFERDTYSVVSEGIIIGSYGISIWSQDWGEIQSPWGKPKSKKWPSYSDGPTSRVPLLGDAIWHNGAPKDTDQPNNAELAGKFGGSSMNRWMLKRHDEGINIAFADGSSRDVPLYEMWRNAWHKDWRVRADVFVPWLRH